MKQLPFNNLTILDCFCGAGLGAIGAELSGFNTIYAFDNNPHAVRNFNTNIKNVANTLDANNIDINSLPDADVITGGFPCKPWSVAGKRQGTSCQKHGNLAQWLIDLILKKEPKAFLIENVKGLISKKNKPYFLKMVEQLEAKFAVNYELLDCSKFGVPQKRERVFIVGIRKDLNKNYEFPNPTNELITVREALRDLPNYPNGENNHDWNEKWTLRNDEKPFAHKIPEGSNWRSLCKDDQRAFLKGAFNGKGGRSGFLYMVNQDKPSRTILSTPMGKNTAQILNFGVGNIRRYTVRESLRLQSVPDWFSFDNETPVKHQYERCSGIPPKVMYLLMVRLSSTIIDKYKEC